MLFSNYILDTLTAPKLSTLTECGAPRVLELPNYDMAIRLKQALRTEVTYKRERTVVLILTFINRLRTSIYEFNQGRECLQQYVSALPNNHHLDFHRKAVAHFENSIIQLHVSIYSMAILAGIAKQDKKNLAVKIYTDEADYNKLRLHSNSIKHFDEEIDKAVAEGKTTPIAPVWLTNEGFECIKGEKLLFSEIVNLFTVQTVDAKTSANLRIKINGRELPNPRLT